jgi:hypothetical protein
MNPYSDLTGNATIPFHLHMRLGKCVVNSKVAFRPTLFFWAFMPVFVVQNLLPPNTNDLTDLLSHWPPALWVFRLAVHHT